MATLITTAGMPSCDHHTAAAVIRVVTDESLQLEPNGAPTHVHRKTTATTPPWRLDRVSRGNPATWLSAGAAAAGAFAAAILPNRDWKESGDLCLIPWNEISRGLNVTKHSKWVFFRPANFSACIPFHMATSAFSLGRRRYSSSRQRCYLLPKLV